MSTSDPRHGRLAEIVKRLPSDFEPLGERSREEDGGPDCSCECRWFIPLEHGLRYDWGVCHNPRSPRCGLLTFEHQGCHEFEQKPESAQPAQLDGRVEREGPSSRHEEVTLLANLKRRRERAQRLLVECSDHWGFEDPVYRFYHQSFKVYALQAQTEAIVRELSSLLPERPLNRWFQDIVAYGTGHRFTVEDNAHWTEVTRPILEAFFHARFFLEMAVRYTELEEPPQVLPSGYAALLYLFDLR
jgi:hypothetical protein